MPRKPSATEHRSPITGETGPQEAQSWSEHEQTSQPTEVEAKKLLDRAGSPGLAKQAIDAAARNQAPPASAKDKFARELGFTSYLELFEASTPVRTAEGKNWLMTALPGGKWTVWNESDLRGEGEFDSMDQARARVPQRDAS
jgi:hypothetical protein